MRRPPWWLWPPAVLAGALVVLPPVALVWRVPWGRVASFAGSDAVLVPLRLSLVTSLAATAAAVVLGVPLARVLAGAEGRVAAVARAAVAVPVVLPPVVAGVALLSAFGRRGLLPTSLAFSTAGAVLAQTFVALPFVVLAAEAGFRAVPARWEDAAGTLGAGRFRVWREVTLPAAGPAVASGAVLAWARALGEFGATITFAGSLDGRTRTMPAAVYLALATDPDAALVLSAVLVGVSLLVLIGLRSRWLPGMRGARARAVPVAGPDVPATGGDLGQSRSST